MNKPCNLKIKLTIESKQAVFFTLCQINFKKLMEMRDFQEILDLWLILLKKTSKKDEKRQN